MDELARSCESFTDYPKNVVRGLANTYQLNQLFRSLNDRDRPSYPLFEDESNASLTFYDLASSSDEFHSDTCRTLDEVKTHLSKALESLHHDPTIRFVFIHARDSRAALNITRDILTFVLSYHQVSPAFLEHIFPFGRQQYSRDFHFIRFKADTMIKDSKLGLRIPELGRSGRELRLLYNLKAVEHSPQQTHWPWSVRQLAVYHAFDIENGHSTWITLKGNEFAKLRVLELLRDVKPQTLNSLESKFALAMQTHAIFCQWSSENFSEYISALEESVQNTTRRALYTNIHPMDPSVREDIGPFPLPTRRTTWKSLWSSEKQNTSSTLGEKDWLSATFMNVKVAQSARDEPRSMPERREVVGDGQTISLEIPQSGRMMPPSLPPTSEAKGELNDQFMFADLQQTQQLIEKIQEALLVVSLNRRVVAEIRGYYIRVLESGHMPKELHSGVVSDFSDDLQGIETDLSLLVSRFESLLSLTQDRKQIMLGFLEQSALLASKELSKREQQSAESIHILTKEMHWTARKTLDDTVSMKIITIVTLFFLPGTFISTIMSTDVVTFSSTNGHWMKLVSMGALQLWFAITVPLTIVTFCAWWFVKALESRRDKWKELKASESIMLSPTV